MGLFDSLLGNATEVNLDELKQEFEPVLVDGEVIESAFQVFRDKWIFTNKRLILLDVMGVSGNKREYMSIPYGSILRFSIVTAGGFLDGDCEMKLWVKGMPEPMVKEFKKNIDIKGLQRTLASYIL